MIPGKLHRAASKAAWLIAAAVLVAGCGEKKDKPATQTAARVNNEEITVHQINFVLEQQRGVPAEQADAAGRQVLERLIDQQLALQKAGEMKLDREPRVQQQIEAARREILSRAYFERVGEGASKPTGEEVRKYYVDNPELFSQRRVYQLQEIAVAARPDQIEALRGQLGAAKSTEQFTEYLKANDIRYAINQTVRAAEQLPLTTLPLLAKLKDGQGIVMPSASGAQVVVVSGSRLQPVEEERARPAIEQFLLNERKRRVIADDLQALRGSAKIQYTGKFAEGAASAPQAGASAAPAVPAAPVVSEPAGPASAPIDTSTINKGLGIK